MKTYLIAYDLGNPNRDYESLYEAIKSVADGWWHHLDSTWLVNSNSTSAQIRDRIKAKIDSNDELLVIDLGRHWATANMPDKANEWLRNSLRPATVS